MIEHVGVKVNHNTVNDTFVRMQGLSGKDTTGPQTGDQTNDSSIGHYMTTGEHITTQRHLETRFV